MKIPFLKYFSLSNKRIIILLILFSSNALLGHSYLFETCESVDIPWLLISSALVMFMQAGFLMLETGLSRLKNSINVAIKNLMDYLVGSFFYFLFGFGIMFGASFQGIFGTDLFFLDHINSGQEYAFFLFQLAFMGTAATIVSGAIAERVKFHAYIIASIVISVLIYPVFGHWAWGGGWIQNLGFIDFAGSTVVHSVGGWVALAGVIVVGPRLDKFDKEGNPKKISGCDLPASVLGVFILWFGWFGFNGGSTLALTDLVPKILVNTSIAASAGGFTAICLSWMIHKKPSIEDSINGTLGGLVAITASCNLVSPVSSLYIGLISGIVVLTVSYIMENIFKLDDVVGAFSVHGACGVLGTLIFPFFISDSNKISFLVQFKGVIICFLWSFTIGLLVFWFLKKIGQLRVSENEEELGLNYSEHNSINSWLELLFSVAALAKGEANLSKRIYAESGSDSGMIAFLMNQFLEKLLFIVNTIKIKSDQLNISATELALGSQNISNNVQEQSTTMDEVVTVVNNTKISLNSILEMFAKQFEITNSLFYTFQEVSKNHTNMDTKLLYLYNESFEFEKITQIEYDKFNKAITKMNEIKTTSLNIKKLVNSIIDISKNLKLLSLNASIEASRTNLSGQGFSVLAEEINKLSLKSSDNAKNASIMLLDIQELLNDIDLSFLNTNESFLNMISMHGKISNELEKVKSMSDSNQNKIFNSSLGMQKLVSVSKNIEELTNDRLNELNIIFNEFDMINQSIADISAQSEQLSSTSESMKELSIDLNQLIFKFEIA